MKTVPSLSSCFRVLIFMLDFKCLHYSMQLLLKVILSLKNFLMSFNVLHLMSCKSCKANFNNFLTHQILLNPSVIALFFFNTNLLITNSVFFTKCKIFIHLHSVDS